MPASALVIIPTYDEAQNIERAISRVFDHVPDAHVLVMDDNSPDGTGAIVDALAATDERVHIEHRTGKQGLGAAYLAGFAWGLAHGYPVLVEMDADGSHPADTLPAMLAALKDDVGLVIGSRWIKGGSVVNWPKRREALSRSANLYTRMLLRIGVRDATAGYRAYRASVIAEMDLSTVASRGYYFQVDMTVRVHDAGHRIVEVPIEFREREAGVSKMSADIIREAMIKVTGLGFRRVFGRRR